MLTQYVGVDFGSAQDNSVICIAERVWEEMEKPWEGREWVATIHVRMLRQYPLGTPYPKIIEDLVAIKGDHRIHRDECAFVLDATGVGLPIFQEATLSGIPALGVIITSGSSVVETDIGYNVPKRDLVMSLKNALENRRLAFARNIDHKQALRMQLQKFTAKMTRSQNLTFEAERERDHDDIVMALSLCVWYDRFLQPYDIAPPKVEPRREHDVLNYGL